MAIESPRQGYYALMIALFGRSGAPPEWRMDAACVQHDPELFTDDNRTAYARAVCQGCSVQARCLTDQLAWENITSMRRANRIGVVGGLTATERRRHDSAERTNAA